MLIRQTLAGVKTATCDMKCFCTPQEIADLDAKTDWLETVFNKVGHPRCNVRITNENRERVAGCGRLACVARLGGANSLTRLTTRLRAKRTRSRQSEDLF